MCPCTTGARVGSRTLFVAANSLPAGQGCRRPYLVIIQVLIPSALAASEARTTSWAWWLYLYVGVPAWSSPAVRPACCSVDRPRRVAWRVARPCRLGPGCLDGGGERGDGDGDGDGQMDGVMEIDTVSTCCPRRAYACCLWWPGGPAVGHVSTAAWCPVQGHKHKTWRAHFTYLASWLLLAPPLRPGSWASTARVASGAMGPSNGVERARAREMSFLRTRIRSYEIYLLLHPSKKRQF
jgi:hypothetical protein